MPRHGAGLGAGAFPSANKLLSRYENDRAQRIHRQKLNSMKHRLDVKEPKKHNHLILRLKQIQKEEERQAEIDHENKLLLAKMTHVMKYGGNIDNWNTYESRSLNYPLRERQNEDIARENLGIARRLETVRPRLNMDAWEKDYKKHAYLKRLWNDNAKDYGVFTPRRFRSRMSKARSLETSLDGDEDTRSMSDDRRLPKLDKSKKSNNLRATQSESNGPVSSRKEEPKSKPSTKFPKIVPHKALIEHDYSMYYGSISSLNKLNLDTERTPRPRQPSDIKPEENDNGDEISPYTARSTKDNTDKKDKTDKGNNTDRNKKKKSDEKTADKNNTNKDKLGGNVKDELHTHSRTSFQSANIPANDMERVETLISKENDKAYDKRSEDIAATSDDNRKEEEDKTDNDDSGNNKSDEHDGNEGNDKHDNTEDIDKSDTKTENSESKGPSNNSIEPENNGPHGDSIEEHEESTTNESEKEDNDKKDSDSKTSDNKVFKEETDNENQTDIKDKAPKHKDNEHEKEGKAGQKAKKEKANEIQKDKPDKKVSKDKSAETGKDKSENKEKNSSVKNTVDKKKGQKADGAAGGGNKDNAQEDSSDVAQLFKIAKQLGKPEEIFIRTLIKKSHKQRMKTKAKFREKYDLDLIKELKNGLGDPWERLIDALLQERGDADCYTLFDALSTNDICDVVELLCSRDGAAVADIKESYRKEFSISIEEDITDRTKPPIQTLLLILQGSREESGDVDAAAARADAKALQEADDSRWDDDEGVFLTLLKTRSFAHMQAVFAEYKSVSEGQDILQAMKADCDKEYFHILSTLVHCIGSPASYYAEQIHKHKLPTDQVLINILVTRSEVDMPAIRKIYKRNYGIDITEEIKSKPHPTQKCLIELVSKVSGGAKAGGDAKQKGAKNAAAPGPATNKKPPAGRPAKGGPDSGQATVAAGGGADTENKPKPTKQKQDNQETDKPALAKKAAEGQGAKKKAPAAQKEDGNHNGTVRPVAGFRPDDDCDRLNGAMSGLGTDEQVIVAIVPRRSNKQRQKLKQVYEQKFKKNLMIDLESELSGDTEEIVLALMMAPNEYDAYILHEAVEGLGTSEGTLVGILCSRSAQEMKSIRDCYKKTYKTEMELDITRDTDGHLKEVFTRLCRGERLEETAVNRAQAKQDAEAMYQKGEAPLDPASDVFQNLLVCKNQYQVKTTMEEYKKLAGHDFYTALSQAGLGDDEESYISIAKAAEDPVAFHTEKLHSCFNNMGTNDNMLIRIIVSRSEIDTRDIKGRYMEMYSQNLVDIIKRDCGGDYKTLLLAVLDENQDNENSENKKGSSASKGGPQKTTKATKESKGEKTKSEDASGAAVKPWKPFNPMEDGVRLHDAMKGFGTDEDVMLEILPKRTNEQRQEIQAKYEIKYNKNLREQLGSELRGDFEEIVLAMMMTPLEYDVYCLHDAVAGLGTSEGILIGILSTHTGKELTIIKEEYKKTYGADLQSDITSDVSGGFEDMLVQILKCEREQGTTVDQQMAADDAKRLYKDGQISIDPKDETFMAIIAKRNRCQVKATFEEYKKLTGNDVYKGIEKALMGDTEKGYKGLALAIEDPVYFYAEGLKQCFDGFGTNDKRLIRIIVSRSEIDLLDIKKKFQSLYTKTLAQYIEDECSGDYKQMLLAVLGDHVTQKNP